ncbi:MAG: F0F1 ATP synthase subunit B [Candidatus Gracilibacteria bacterium]|jgi:F-type H+-transporting ATPase subunit b
MELITKLGIDPTLLIAQVINFLILFFILKKLIYKPLLSLFDKRKKMIEKNVEDTKRIEERLEKLEVERKAILSDASKEAMAVVENAKKESEKEREEVLAKAKKEISTLAGRYREQLASEKANIISEIKAEMAELIVAGSRKIIEKEFSEADQKRLVEAVNKELKSVK